MLSKLALNISGSATLEIAATAKKLKTEGKNVISLSAGEPDFDTPDFIKEAAIAAIKSGDTKYTPASGSATLKEAVIHKFKTENSLLYSPSEILISCGAKHSLYNIILSMVGPGDEVIIPSPYWVSYPEIVKASGATPVIADCLNTEMKLTPEVLLPLINGKTKLLIINSPSNPTGEIYSYDELFRIAEIVLDNNLMVISDEIYEHFSYDSTYYSIASLSKELKSRTLVINGVSKAYSMTGWRIGYAAGNSDIIAAGSRLQSHSTSNPTSFAQSGAAVALTSPKSSSVLKQMSAEFNKRRNYIYDRLSNINGLSVKKPAGAFYIFPNIKNISNGISSMEFSKRILKEKYLAIVPGEGFGAPGFVRLSYAAAFEDIKEGLDRFESFINA